MSLKDIYSDLTRTNSWNTTFQQIKNHVAMNTMNEKQCLVGRNIENRQRNKYREIVPYDDNRVILRLLPGETNNYVNASYIRLNDSRYIVTQCPSDNTINLFWSMVWNESVHHILMLNRTDSFDRGSYIPTEDNKVVIYSNSEDDSVQVFTISYVECINYHGFYHTKLRIYSHQTDKSRQLDHVTYYGWPEQGAPLCTESFFMLTAFMQSLQTGMIYPDNDKERFPVLVHCNAGAGRSGTYCLVDIALCMIEEKKSLDSGIDLLGLCRELRLQRLGMVNTVQQLKFAFEAVIEAYDRLHRYETRNKDSIEESSFGMVNRCEYLDCNPVSETCPSLETCNLIIVERDEARGDHEDDSEDIIDIDSDDEDFDDNEGVKFSLEEDDKNKGEFDIEESVAEEDHREKIHDSPRCLEVILAPSQQSLSLQNSDSDLSRNSRASLLQERRNKTQEYLKQYEQSLLDQNLKRKRVLKSLASVVPLPRNQSTDNMVLFSGVLLAGTMAWWWWNSR